MMRGRLFWSMALMTTLLAVRAAQAQDSKSKSSDQTSSIDASTLKAGEYVGKLVGTPDSDGQFSIRIEQYEPKDAAAATKATNQLNADVQRARQLEQQVAANPTPGQINALKQQYEQIRKEQTQLRDLYNVTYKDIEFHAADGMMVRFLKPPVVYDDKGERKNFNSAELAAMRGFDSNVPGYEAKLSDLQPNQIIRVSLRTAKPASADSAKAAPVAGDDKQKTKAAPKMEAAMTVILVQEDMTAVKQDSKDAGKKKKK
jgi:hypothetical protein